MASRLSSNSIKGLEITSLKIYPVKSLGGISLSQVELSGNGFAWDRHWMVVSSDGMFITQRTLPQMAMVSVSVNQENSELVLKAKGHRELRVGLASSDTSRLREVKIHGARVGGIEEHSGCSRWLTKVLGRYEDQDLHLVRFPPIEFRSVDPDLLGKETVFTEYADTYPLLVISEESLRDLNDRLIAGGAKPIGMERFRPNLVIRSGAPYNEDRFASLRMPNVRIKLSRPCNRCNVTTIDQSTGEIQDPKEPLATLATYRKSKKGVIFGMNAFIERGAGTTLHVGDELKGIPKNPTPEQTLD